MSHLHPRPEAGRRAWRVVPLLALSMVVAVPAAWAQDGADQDKSAAEIQKLGGKLDRDDKAPGKPITNVSLAITKVSDGDLVHLEKLVKLRRLSLVGTPITDAGLDHLKGLTELKRLYLVDTKVGDAGLERLKELKGLEVLSLVGTQVTDAAVDTLKDLPNLRDLF